VRRARPPKARLKLLGAGAFFGIILTAATSVMMLRTKEPMACDRALPMTIAATPAIAPAIQAITNRDIQLPCAEVKVVAQSAAETAETIAIANGEMPALWIPDSSLWPRRATQQATHFVGTPSIEQREPLVISPLVMVTTGAKGGGGPDVPVGWQDLAGGQAAGLATIIGDPLSTTEGLATLAAVHGMANAPRPEVAKPELIGAMLQVGRDAAPSIQSAYDRLGSGPLAFTATEQSVVSYNRGSPSAPAVAVYPREGTIALEYPLVRVIEPDEPPALADLADRVEQALRTPMATSTLLAAGFRSPHGDLDPSIAATLGVPPSRPALLPSPTAEQATDVLRTWSAVTLNSRMLVVIDVSSSMDADAGNGRSRIELTRDVSIAALGLFPDTTSIGLWAFSTGKVPPDDWVELVPLGPLAGPLSGPPLSGPADPSGPRLSGPPLSGPADPSGPTLSGPPLFGPADPSGRGTRRQALLAATQSLPSHTGGGTALNGTGLNDTALNDTALNDTALAAVRSVRGSYEAGRVNSVVLFTDGRNEDPSGIDTATLIRTLRAENDPTAPVPIILIGIGPEVDFKALREISAATGGKAYLASDPNDFHGVFLDALILRQCRPAC
jgi:Ca-activated chloride channel family protein